VYGVRTTGVACRPSCASRRPLRRNVELFATLDEAVRAGYRACLRCRGAPAASLPGAVERAVAHLEARLDERVTLAELATAVGLSPWHLQRAFTREVGASPRAYQERRRLERFKSGVREGASVGEATYAAGFGSSRALYQSARSGLGMTPAAYRRGGRGERIAWAVAPAEPGLVLVAATGRGVCAVELGDDAAALTESLAREFPAAELAEDGPGGRVAALARQVVATLDGARPRLTLDLRGTAFQLRVWRALQDIPRGETRSYAQVAAAIGQPSASRAVARACATNRVALLIPCHRVVRGTGETGGYRWGAARKRQLLAAERGAARGAGGRAVSASSGRE
jgi:AraC family transcriptional regulator, regulatory protein of adaptative response / methylated-DNA-[protein]-cysteine methyltransferase